MEASDLRIKRLNHLVKQLKKIRSVQGGLLHLSELASKVQDLTEFYPQLNYAVSSILKADNFFIALENNQQELELVYFVDEKDDSTVPEANGIETGITGYVHKNGCSVICDKDKYRQMVEQQMFDQLGTEPELWFGVPLKRGNRCIGVMAVQSYTEVDDVDEHTIALFENLGLHLMTAINRVKRREFLEQEIKKQTKNLQVANRNLQHQICQREHAEQLQQVLFQISEMSASNLKMDAFYHELHASLSQLMDVKNCYIALLEDNKLSFPFFVDKYRTECASRHMAKGLTEYTITQKQSQLIDTKRAAELQKAGLVCRELTKEVNISTCWLGAPLIIDDQVIGVITVQSYDDETQYTDKDLQLLNFVSHHIARAVERRLSAQALQNSYDELEKKISERTQELRQANLFLRLQVEERKKAEQKLYHQANHDVLTGLPNRACFLSKVEQTLARAKRYPEHKFAVLFIDLDNFKKINDCHGHQAGDEFLIEVSQRLRLSVRDNDAIGRLGGDEFVILLDLLSDSQLAEEIATRIIDTIAKPFALQECQVSSGASIGIALFEQDYQNVESIVQDADLAMYQAKAMGRGQFVVFEPSMRNTEVNASLPQSIRASIDEDAVLLETQAILSSTSDSVCGQLMRPRWLNKKLQQLPQKHYEQELEQQGLRLDFDYALLRQQANISVGNDNSVISLLPISAKHLTHLRYVKRLVDEMRSQTNLAQLCLIFRESDLVKLDENHLNNVKQLKRCGVKVGIERFGESHLSIGLLAKMPVDFLLFDGKLIKSVAANPVESALLTSALTLCTQLKIRPVLTGVDLPQHLTRADDYRVDLVAGELICQKTKQDSALTVQHRA